MLDKADPDLSSDAKTALVQRQFMKGLPNILKFKLLEQNPTPTLEETLSFTQRYRAVEGYVQPVGNDVAAVHSTAEKDQSQLSQLVAIVAGIAEKQQSLADRLAKAEKANTDDQNDRRGRRLGACFTTCFTAANAASLWDPKLDVHRPVFPVVSWGIFLETAVLL